jgi:hypothetical protein
MSDNDNQFVVITTINQPSDAVRAYAKWKNWRVIVIGDRKTDRSWKCDGVSYFGLESQYAHPLLGQFARKLPENSYTRKMFGYAFAIHSGATALFETDDDNYPYDGAEGVLEKSISAHDEPYDRVTSESGWVNIYRNFVDQFSWPRGFPIELTCDSRTIGIPGVDTKPWMVKQFLANTDPDVDAIYRLIISSSIDFKHTNKSFLLDEGCCCPFNSQATLWLPAAFPLLFLPTSVSDRVTDILRGFIALACLWKIGGTVAFSGPIVYQERNAHNLLNDFAQEIPLYLNARNWSNLLQNGITGSDPAALFGSAIRLLYKNNIVTKDCIDLYEIFQSFF